MIPSKGMNVLGLVVWGVVALLALNIDSGKFSLMNVYTRTSVGIPGNIEEYNTRVLE